MKSQSYMTRALRARDPRFAQILGNLGYGRGSTPSVAPEADPLDHDGDGKKGGSKPAEQSEDLSVLRAEYQTVLGKKPFHGWDAETLKAKIAEAKA